jgi:transposase-like protein
VIPDIPAKTLRAVVLENVEPGSVVSTDELMSYGLLTGDGFIHGAVKHSAKEWMYYGYRTRETHGIESFWHLFKYSVRSTHIQVSREKLPLYLAEFCYRSNHRAFGNLMFDALLASL